MQMAEILIRIRIDIGVSHLAKPQEATQSRPPGKKPIKN